MTKPNIAEFAQGYLARGWPVIPVEPGGKRPLVRWESFQTRLPTLEELAGWLRRWPDANLGVVTGHMAGLVVLDIDPPHQGDDSLLELERVHGTLPQTIEALTGSGGRHVYFAHPGGTLRNKVGLAPGIDLRGDGGMIVVPPSLHASGRRYEWELSHLPEETTLAPLPAWLLRLAGGAGGPGEPLGHPLTYWRTLLHDGVPAGVRNNSIASLAGHLLRHGVDPEVMTELLLCWNRVRCRPPLDDAEVVRTCTSIRKTHEGRTALPPG